MSRFQTYTLPSVLRVSDINFEAIYGRRLTFACAYNKVVVHTPETAADDMSGLLMARISADNLCGIQVPQLNFLI